ncbi:NAD(P)H-hydrate epimerase [Rhizobium sp. Root274]|uniref:bifunctional ADP-dependent NAD(P)H-hydrate dehydratase/NAD(P)H-hydrate epimerase n=1 Tax=unclassified Rhizobium TaxID=2613769 RepID=UPI0007129326|nr:MULTISPECIES: bifunctional ADP-dependent NAD(P)H-hydrate dehydratase/NAD(P)H-hydrate epimerase [unclassified Rhizobium]KQW27009.1 NAD(P)H-hydrate epimerase [Rhizobium sp. Root1240]KRD27929.1 NAD(P)H-hydrate epimerase [Rhizobium sp. Root274]
MIPANQSLLLTPEAMARVDAAAAATGQDSYGLMRRAGEAVAAAALRLYPGALRFVVVCGPGNNGGDGYVCAEALRRAGAATAIFHLGDPERLKGDARRARTDYGGSSQGIAAFEPVSGDVVIDALFGAGLARDVPPEVSDLIQKVMRTPLPVIAVDLPSGLDGASGQVRGAAFRASHTITFMARKPGHVLLPGRDLCGKVEVFDIGIPWRLLQAEAAPLQVNNPSIWRASHRAVDASDHKYRRGHLTVFSGPETATGAARLSAMAGLKAGAGLVTIASPKAALAANAVHLTAIMLTSVDNARDLQNYLEDVRRLTFVLGPGFGDPAKAKAFAIRLGQAGRHLVLDADGITAFRQDRDLLTAAFEGEAARLVVTPHEGEFARLFPEIAGDETRAKPAKALAAAAALGGVVVYKGADTVIASPDGRAAIEEHAPPNLATAGSGDVLAGIIGALLAQGLPAFEAACAGVHLHGQAALRAGPGLTAEDLAGAVLPA